MQRQSRDGTAIARLTRLWKHIVECWPKALLVTSIATILDLRLKWLEPLQQAVFVVMGNYVALHGAAPTANVPRVAVVEIDEPVYSRLYNSGAPLDRCLLTRQLRAIYEAKPNVVAVDLDLSAADVQPGAVSASASSACEKELYAEITRASENDINTVLLAPESAPPREGLRSALTARSSGKILIADGRLPVTNGFTLGYFRSGQSFSEIVRTLREDSSYADGAELPEPVRLDPRAYRDRLHLLPLSRFLSSGAGLDLKALTHVIASDLSEVKPPRVVFFGGAYEPDDLFLTPIGPVYGVEAHAAAYVDNLVTPDRIAEFIFDLCLAFIFGPYFERFWRQYCRDFKRRDTHLHYTAGWRILGFSAKVLLVGAGFSLLTAWIFAGRDLWISPLSLALTLLFDSFIGGVLSAAREVCSNGHPPRRPERFWANLAWLVVGDLQARSKTAAPGRTLAAGIADRLLWLILVSFAVSLLYESIK